MADTGSILSTGNRSSNKGGGKSAIEASFTCTRTSSAVPRGTLISPSASIQPARSPYCNRGEVYRQWGERDRAVAEFNQAIKLNPKYATAYNNRGAVFLEKGWYDRALKDFQEAIRLNPNYAIAIKNRNVAARKKTEGERPI